MSDESDQGSSQSSGVYSINKQQSSEDENAMKPKSSQLSRLTINSIQKTISQHITIKDESEVFSMQMIGIALYVATFCGLAAFTLHMGVYFAGCISGVNGCHDHVLLDKVKSWGISQSAYFTITSALSGLICSLVIYAPFRNGVLKSCKGGGSAGTKITVSAGKRVSGWVAVFRIVLCMIYLGGGNTLGTEGPIIHLSSSFATFLVSIVGIEGHKNFSIFAVVGAAAGISAGFNVLVTGIVFVIEELTRTLRPKVSLLIALAAAWAVFVKHKAEQLLEEAVHMEHVKMVPKGDVLKSLTDSEANVCLLLCIPIGIINGIAGYVFAQLAWKIQAFLTPGLEGRTTCHSYFIERFLPKRSHLMIIGLINGAMGALVYEVTKVNAVWGTTVGQVPTAIKKSLVWYKALILFVGKLSAVILATAGGGPGGTLVPALIAGGFMGIVVARVIDAGEVVTSATAVIGMGSLFASIMHMPVTGVVIIFELTHADNLMLHVVIANFIASNVCARLPHGAHSYVHTCLAHDPVWRKMGGQDFIETDDHASRAENPVGHSVRMSVKTSCEGLIMDKNEEVLLAKVFKEWFDLKERNKFRALRRSSSWVEDAMSDRVFESRARVCERFLSLDSMAITFASLWWWRTVCTQRARNGSSGKFSTDANKHIDNLRCEPNDLSELPFPRRPPDIHMRGSQSVLVSQVLDV